MAPSTRDPTSDMPLELNGAFDGGRNIAFAAVDRGSWSPVLSRVPKFRNAKKRGRCEVCLTPHGSIVVV
jgi:hypothetical protein